MLMNIFRKGLLASVAGISLLAGSGHAAVALPTTYSGLVIFGDSISDTGNVRSLTIASQLTNDPQPIFPNYFAKPGRFSDGMVWTEHLAVGLGFASSANPSNLLFDGTNVIPIGAQGGQNFAYGGARTGLGGSAGPTTGLLGQLVAWDNSTSILGNGPLTRTADPDALYVVVAGANDVRDFRSGEVDAQDPVTVAGNIVSALGLLANAGARHFLISTLPDLGLTPEAAGLNKNNLDLVDVSRAATLSFNSALTSLAGSFAAGFKQTTSVDLDVRTLDFFGLVNRIAADATSNSGGLYGITNITTPCINPVAPFVYFVPGATGPACGVASFSDNLHPSAASHALLGELAVHTATAPIPEPAEYAMLIAGLLVIAGACRRARKTAA